MTDFRDVKAEQRFEQGFVDPGGETRIVWADYAAQGDRRVILHVEAEDALRGTGAAGRFMASLVDHARAEGLKLTPRCSYAVAWFRRHPDQGDLLA
jgi:predicted GNAT family acetyltransferase